MTDKKFHNADELLEAVDADLFQQQRQTLLEMAFGNPALPQSVREDLQGLVTLMDHLADYMADYLGMTGVLLVDSWDGVSETPKDNTEGNEQ